MAAKKKARAEATLEVVELATGKVIHEVKVDNPDAPSRGQRKIDTVEDGMMRNMDLDRFSVREKGRA